MKRNLSVISAIIILFSTAAFAQDDVRPDFVARRTALLFTFSGLGNLGAGNFEGGIGAKMFFTPVMAVRAGLSFATASETTPFTAAALGQEGKKSATGFGISGAVEYHLTSTRVSPYIGGGLSLATLSTQSTNPVPAGTLQTTIKNNLAGETISGQNYIAGTTFSVFALAGAEFFLFKELSLAAEYRLGFSTSSHSDQEVSVGGVTNTTTGGSSNLFGINSQGFLTLAFYF